MLRTAWQRRLAMILCVVSVGACTASEARTATSDAASTRVTTQPVVAWPGSYSDGVEGRWTVELTRPEILARAREQKERNKVIDLACVRDYIDAVGFERTLTWDLYLRDGRWVMLGARDGEKPVPYDGGTYAMPYMELEWALFTSTAPGVRDDVWLVPWIEGDSLKMDLIDLTQWVPEKTMRQHPKDPYCFVEGAAVVELTNTFDRVT